MVNPYSGGTRSVAAATWSLIVLLSLPGPFTAPGLAAPALRVAENQALGNPEAGEAHVEERRKIQALQEQMLDDPETLGWIEELKNDPSMQEILKDQELLAAIERGDLARVSADPKIKTLMNSAAFKKILEKNR